MARRTSDMARLLAGLAVTKRNSTSRQLMFNRLCEFMLNAGGVYTKFLQGVLLGITEVQHWIKAQSVDFFEQVPQEPLQVGEILHHELGEHVSRLRMWPDAVASGTFAQVYAGVLDERQPVIIKVQRRTIKPSLKYDVWLLKKFARYGKPFLTNLDADIGTISRDFARLTVAEMNYEHEATMGERLRKRVAEANVDLIIPRTYQELSTGHVLIQERLGGVSLAELIRSPVPLTPEQRQILQKMMTDVLLLPFTTGLVHADPHPGNIRLIDMQVALLDFGAVDDKYVDMSIYKILLEAVIKAMDGTMTASEALQAYFATYAPRLHRALEVTSQALNIPPVFELFARSSLGSQANVPQSNFKDNVLALSDINRLVNPGNRFMLKSSLQNVSYSRAIHTLAHTMQLLGLHTEMKAALRQVGDQIPAFMHLAKRSAADNLSVFEAKEIVYNWLNRVMERNPMMARDLRRNFQALREVTANSEQDAKQAL